MNINFTRPEPENTSDSVGITNLSNGNALQSQNDVSDADTEPEEEDNEMHRAVVPRGRMDDFDDYPVFEISQSGPTVPMSLPASLNAQALVPAVSSHANVTRDRQLRPCTETISNPIRTNKCNLRSSIIIP